jgi:predicted TIM-barrel fold metal-dependent hydrolase
MARYALISCDTHAGPTPEIARDYVRADLRERYDDFTAWIGGRTEEAASQVPEKDRSTWDMATRTRFMREEHLVGEVMFPNFVPFHGMIGSFGPGDHQLALEGGRAYNRWLADFVASSPHPERHAGIAFLTQTLDIDAALDEVRWAREAGLRGVMIRSQPELAEPPWNHERYDPLWAVCAELGMPIHTHGGQVAFNPEHTPGRDPACRGSMPIFFAEAPWFGHRLLWTLIFSGVLERNPALKVVFTEQWAYWLTEYLVTLDYIHDGFSQHSDVKLPMKPSEYWQRQCYVGSSLTKPREIERRDEFGAHTLMWGNDFPHLEGTHPHTEQTLRECFGNVPDAERRNMLAGTAAEVYGFDLEALQPAVEDVGLAAGFFDEG